MKLNRFAILLLVSLKAVFADSRIELVTINSAALGISKSFNIYLPDGYDGGSQRYPVIYLFRGHENEWVNPNEDPSRGGKNIKNVADELVQAGQIGGIILVMPGLSSADNAIPGLGVNFLDVSLAGNRSGIGTGRFEDYMINDLIPFIDNNYRTLPERSQHGVDGFSLGGYAAILLATKHPELFSSAGTYDGTMMWLDLDDPRNPGPRDDFTWLSSSFFDPAFGSPRDVDYMKQYNMANLIHGADAATLALLPSIQFLIHSAGSEQAGNLDRSQHIVDLLENKGIQNAFADIRLTPTAVHNWQHADLHMRRTLPLHWTRFQNPVQTIPLRILAPTAGSALSGTVEIKWSPGAPIDNPTTILAFSRDAGKAWQTLAVLASNDTTFLWNTQSVPDGTRYLLRVTVADENIFAVSATPERFTINNPDNGIPEIELLSPNLETLLTGVWPIRWFADDADDDALIFSMDYSTDDGLTWSQLFSNLQNTDEYLWNTRLFQNGSGYRVIFYCTDGTVQVSDTSGTFQVFNERQTISSSEFIHVAGSGGGRLSANIVDANLLTGHLYRITFDDTTFAEKVYDVRDLDAGALVVDNAKELDGATEGPLFDGMRLVIRDPEQVEVDLANTGWRTGVSPWRAHITVPELSLGFEAIKGFPYPADYVITLSANVVDTSISAYGVPAVPLRFTVWNETENHPVDIIFIERVKDQKISPDDRILILEPDETGMPRLTWSILFSGAANDSPPQPGDAFVFKTLRPLSNLDVYEFRAIITSVNEPPALPESPELFSNYPNPFNPGTTISYYLPRAEQVKVVVINLLGQEVITLVNERQNAGRHVINWNGNHRGGAAVGSGIYFYKLIVEGRSLTGKMLLVR